MMLFNRNSTKILIASIILMLFSTNLKSEEIQDTLYLRKDQKIKDTVKNNRIYLNVDKDASLANGRSIYQQIKDNVVIPKNIKKDSIKGNVAKIGLVISDKGEIDNIKFFARIEPALDAEILKAIAKLPPIIPAQKNGKNVKMHLALAFPFSQIEKKENMDTTKGVWGASFPGGNDALMAYIRENLKYPASAVKKISKGRLLSSFI